MRSTAPPRPKIRGADSALLSLFWDPEKEMVALDVALLDAPRYAAVVDGIEGTSSGGYVQRVSPRRLRVSELSGPAAEAVEAARRGHEVLVTADGDTVARIVPARDDLDARLARVAGRFRTKGPLGPEEIDDAIANAAGR